MFDLDFGIKTWYLKPSFYVKVVCGILSLSFIVYLIVLESKVNDIFFPTACSGVPRNLVAAIIFFLIMTAAMCVVYFKKLLQYKLYATIAFICSEILILVLCISYSASFHGSSNFDKYYRKAMDYTLLNPNDKSVDYFRSKTNYDKASGEIERRELCYSYLHQRLGGACLTIIWLSLTWFITFSFVILDSYMREESYDQIE